MGDGHASHQGNRLRLPPGAQTDFFCVACQKDMDPAKPCRAVHVVQNFPMLALHPADEAAYVSDGRRYGLLPIGECCGQRARTGMDLR